MRLLLLSNSTNVGESYLEYPKNYIKSFLGNKPLNLLFIPYAAVTFSFDEYEEKVKNRFSEIGHYLTSVHKYPSPIEALNDAEALIVGGGNTFHLLKLLQDNKLISSIRERVLNGLPYIGWSAGANLACPGIFTTNDMPIVAPNGFVGFNLLPFQINPHYTDWVMDNHGGETRDQRITEFLHANPQKMVIGLREGTMLKYEDGKLSLNGEHTAKIFQYGKKPFEVSSETDMAFLMKANY